MTRPSEEEKVSVRRLEQVAEIARQLAETETVDELLHRVVEMGESYLDGCDGVSLMVVGPRGKVSTPAFSSTVARDGDYAQYESGEGPCLRAIREEATVIIDDLETDERWPAYRERALKLGVRSMISFRLFVAEENTLGALDFYSLHAHAFDRHSQVLGQVFASYASVVLKAAVTEAGLEQALQSRDLIGQAKGVVMAKEQLTADEAFARLARISQAQNRKLRDVAETIATTGEVPNIQS